MIANPFSKYMHLDDVDCRLLIVERYWQRVAANNNGCESNAFILYVFRSKFDGFIIYISIGRARVIRTALAHTQHISDTKKIIPKIMIIIMNLKCACVRVCVGVSYALHVLRQSRVSRIAHVHFNKIPIYSEHLSLDACNASAHAIATELNSQINSTGELLNARVSFYICPKSQ